MMGSMVLVLWVLFVCVGIFWSLFLWCLFFFFAGGGGKMFGFGVFRCCCSLFCFNGRPYF